MAKSYYNVIETLVSIFAVDKGTIKILLKRKKREPYRNYWIIPGHVLSNEETLETSVKKTMENINPVNVPYIYETKSFSSLDRDPVERIIATNFNAIVVKELVNDYEMEWFDIYSLPKMAYDHEQIIESNIKDFTQ